MTVQVSRLRTGWRAEVAGPVAGGLDGVVDVVDVVVGRGDQRHAVAVLVVVDPGGGDPGEVLVEAAGDDAAVGFVGVQDAWVAGAQLE